MLVLFAFCKDRFVCVMHSWQVLKRNFLPVLARLILYKLLETRNFFVKFLETILSSLADPIYLAE